MLACKKNSYCEHTLLIGFTLGDNKFLFAGRIPDQTGGE